MMRKRDFLKVGTAAAATLAAASAHAQQSGPVYKWRMATGWPGGPLMDVGSNAFAERLNQLSGGRFQIQTFPGGALGAALKVSETVRNGVSECGHLWMGWDWGKDPTTVLFGGYAGSMDSERMLHWLYEGGGDRMQRTYREEMDGIVSFPLFIRTAEVFLHSRKPVRTLADLKGLRLRTAGAWLEMAKELGAAPVTTAPGEIYPMLERGAIDATEWGTLWENITPGFHRVAKFVILPGVHQPVAPFELVINRDIWAKVTPPDRRLVELVAKLVTFESWLKIGNEDARAIEFYRKAGNEIIELDLEVIRQTRKIGRDWALRTAKGNDWFRKVLASQDEFEKVWAGAERWRTIPV
jgi:TRAP-type mannitol/chloroaromatic compound transport system substrate-binding protein